MKYVVVEIDEDYYRNVTDAFILSRSTISRNNVYDLIMDRIDAKLKGIKSECDIDTIKYSFKKHYKVWVAKCKEAESDWRWSYSDGDFMLTYLVWRFS